MNTPASSTKRRPRTSSFASSRGSMIDQPTVAGPVDSPFKTVQLDFTASLPPSYMGRVSRGVHELLNSQLLKYDQRVRGVLLGYSDVELTEKVGHTCFETPDILFQARTEALVFCVDKGVRLRGVVSQVTAGHMALLCCGAFQVTIPREHIPDVLEYNKDAASWSPKDGAAAGSLPTLSAGSAVRFVVKGVQGSGTQWSIEGGLLLGDGSTDDDDDDVVEQVQAEQKSASKSKKAKKNKKEKSNKRPQPPTVADADDSSDVVAAPTTSAKKRKKLSESKPDGGNNNTAVETKKPSENGTTAMTPKQLKQARREARKQKAANTSMKKKAKKNKNKN